MAVEIYTTKFDALSDANQPDVREKTEEWYLVYVFLHQSRKQHNKLRVDLQNDFTTGDDPTAEGKKAIADIYPCKLIVVCSQ
jgi:hypothetical protein